MSEPSFCTTQIDVNEKKGVAKVWDMLLDSKGVEHEYDEMFPKMEQTDTTKAELKPHVDNVVLRTREMVKTIAARTAFTTEKVVAKKISAILSESINSV